MLIIKYFLVVGAVLSSLIFAWSAYLEPASVPARPTALVAKAEGAFRPTPAPPLSEQSTEAAPTPTATEQEASDVQAPPVKTARVNPRKPRRTIARPRTPPDNSYAYAPTEPFFFGWR
jgi:hypothetical protein